MDLPVRNLSRGVKGVARIECDMGRTLKWIETRAESEACIIGSCNRILLNVNSIRTQLDVVASVVAERAGGKSCPKWFEKSILNRFVRE
jgi:hypothetical protein